MKDAILCPRCHSKEFAEIDCGEDTYDFDLVYMSERCKVCGLWHDGWCDNWYIDVESWRDIEDAEIYCLNKIKD